MANSLKFLLQSDVHRIFEHFTVITGIRIGFFSPEGQELAVGSNKQNCRYCDLLRNSHNLAGTCLELDAAMRCEAHKRKNMVAYQCHGGMREAIFPVYSAEKLMGFIMIGQFRTEDLAALKLENISPDESKALEDAYGEVPCYSLKQLPHILGLFCALIELIISRRMISVIGNAVDPLLNYMSENIDMNISLEDAAGITGRSKSSLQHLFKGATGKSFKQYQIELKLAKADELMSADPDITVSKIAYAVGFEDPFYFSRLYKKYRKISPGSRIAQIRQGVMAKRKSANQDKKSGLSPKYTQVTAQQINNSV